MASSQGSPICQQSMDWNKSTKLHAAGKEIENGIIKFITPIPFYRSKYVKGAIKNMEKRLLTINQKTKDLIEEKFQFKKELAREKEELLFSVFNEPLSKGEELALKFLYAYMPLNDLADYEGDLFLAHVKKAFSIQKTVPWRDKIPVETFLYFILPYRVNNENIEDFRMILFEEIFPRVKNLSMKEAILETNHW